MPDQVPTNQLRAVESPKPLMPYRVWGWRGLLALFLAYLLFRAWQARTTPFEQVDWKLQSANEFVAWLRNLVGRELLVLGLSFVLGLLTPPAWRPTAANADRTRRWPTWLAWLCFGLVTLSLCFAIAWNEVPPVGSLLLPFVSYLAGLHLSSAALRGIRPLAWAAAQWGVLLLLLVGTTAALAGTTISTAPLDFEPTEMSTAEKRQLAQRIRDTRPPEGQPRQLRMADAEINALANAALGQDSARRKASMHFDPSTFEAQASLALPPREGESRFLNVRAAGRVAIDEGHLQLDVERLRVGRLDVPAPLLRLLSSTFHAMLMEDPQVRRITEAIDKLETQQGAVNLVFEPGAIHQQIVPSLAQILWRQPDVAFETGLYLRHLIGIYDGLPAQADRFGLLLQAAFKMAAERSKNHDPLLENRAAIFALAILLGHQDLEPFVGEVLGADERVKASKIIGNVTLRGRQDLPRHFLVSAALALLSNEATSDRIGVMKEQLDSQDGGSGFSFVDLLANMSGTRFAVTATRDAATARAMQAKLASGFKVDAVFPKIDGLPENIPAEELQSRYGGVGGTGYQKIIEEINRRLDALPKV